MSSNKEEMVAISQQSAECCMCGDSGLTQELFHCKVCQFRSQHRYCSNIYPKALSYKVCNWCLNNQKEDSKDQKSQNSSNSSASCKYNSEDYSKKKMKKGDNDGGAGLKGQQKKLQQFKDGSTDQESHQEIKVSREIIIGK